MDDAQEQDMAMEQALTSMKEAMATPWVRELIERRERQRLEDEACLAKAIEDGIEFVKSQSPNSASFEEEANEYASRTAPLCLGPVPPRRPPPTDLDPVQLKWWIFDRDKAERDHTSYRITFQKKLKDNFLRGCFTATGE